MGSWQGSQSAKFRADRTIVEGPKDVKSRIGLGNMWPFMRATQLGDAMRRGSKPSRAHPSQAGRQLRKSQEALGKISLRKAREAMTRKLKPSLEVSQEASGIPNSHSPRTFGGISSLELLSSLPHPWEKLIPSIQRGGNEGYGTPEAGQIRNLSF